MISKKISSNEEIRARNISQALSKNMLGVIFGFFNLNNLLILGSVNKKFKEAIEIKNVEQVSYYICINMIFHM